MSVDRSIDPLKLQGAIEYYQSRYGDRAAKIIRRIVDHTIYVSEAELLSGLAQCITRLNEEYPRYNLFVPGDRLGSEHWLLLELKHILKPQHVIMGNRLLETLPPNDDPIVIIDDAIYSSCQMCGHIDNLKFEHGLSLSDIRITNPFVLVVHTTSSLKTQVSTDFGATIIAHQVLENLQCKNLLEDYDYDYMYEVFKIETDCVLPVYFDHKVANTFGSYPFYHAILKNPVSRKKIDGVTWSDMEMLFSA